MTKRVTQLTLERFRGASQPLTLDLDPKQQVVMIFGENGTGKSTIVDAIDAICNREVGSVAFRKAGNAPWNYLPSLNGVPPKSFSLRLATQNGGLWEASLNGKNIQVQEIAAGAAPVVRVLRRSQLLTLIESEPVKRYAAISDFVNVDGVQQSEDALNAALLDLKKRLNDARVAFVEAETALQGLYEEHGTHDAALDARAWAQLRTEEDQSDLLATHKAMIGWQQQVQNSQGLAESWQRAASEADARQAALAAVETRLQLAQGKEEANRESLARLLAEAQGYVAGLQGEAPCPLCARPTDADGLRAEIARQLTSLRATMELVREKRQAEQDLRTAQRQMEQAQATLLGQLRPVAQHLAAGSTASAVPFEAAHYAHLLDVHDSSAAAAREAAALSGLLPGLAELATQQAERLHKRLHLSSTIEQLWQRVQDNELVVQDNTDLAGRLERALDIVRTERRTYTQAILDSISDEVNRLYRAIHPAEDIGLDKFKLDEKKRASLDQYAVFCGKTGILPQAYFSESHLDTFGFCLWLALAKRTDAAHTVLVLDDVFTSVDMPHFRRITDLLGEEATHFQQLIIATHNRSWHELYKQEGVGAQLIKLEEWNLGNGVRAFPEKIMTDALADALRAAPFNRQAVGSQAGILLEAVLDELTLIYGLSLKRKYGNAYELGDLLGSTIKLLQKAEVTRYATNASGQLVVPHTQEAPVPIKPLFDAVNGLKFIRNEIGCHFNRKGNEYPDADVRAFGEATLALVKALTCPRCGRLARKELGTVRGCACPKHKMEMSPAEV